MKIFKLLLVLFISSAFFSSCTVTDDTLDNSISLGELMSSYDLWYVDYHATIGSDQIPFMQLAFTLSFNNGNMYANNNISGIRLQGNGVGIQIGSYTLNREKLFSDHELDGFQDFEIIAVSGVENEIEMYHAATNTSYFLIGYDIEEFDYDKLFYENIEYLLQDFEIWEKFETSMAGRSNEFDNENFLSFTSENNNTFYSSKSMVGTNIDLIYWDYAGSYTVKDVIGYDDLKVLTLGYDSINTETFELTVLSDSIVELFHISSETVYRFKAAYFIQYLKDEKPKKKDKIERKRRKIKRQKVYKIS